MENYDTARNFHTPRYWACHYYYMVSLGIRDLGISGIRDFIFIE